jgi:glucose-6-phosphate 1-dehydrogenase
LQNHLLQVLTLMCMDPPFVVEGPRSGRAIRDAKVQVLNAMDVIQLEDVVLGQYEGYAGTLASSSQVRSTPRSCSLSRPQK